MKKNTFASTPKIIIHNFDEKSFIKNLQNEKEIAQKDILQFCINKAVELYYGAGLDLEINKLKLLDLATINNRLQVLDRLINLYSGNIK